MTEEKLKIANEILYDIKKLKEIVQSAEWMLSENVAIRESILSANGLRLEVPETLFKIFGKLILNEYKIELLKLEDKFNNI
jgi:hypothetical protein